MKNQLLCKLLSCKQNHLVRFVRTYDKFTLITSEDCGLCYNFKRQLDNWNNKNGKIINYEVVPLKLRKEIFEKFKYDQPVLLHKDRVVLKHNFKSIISMYAVHGGAGYHFKGVEQYCKKAVKIALKNSDVVDGVTYLEDIDKFNCGYGSNLTKSGRVECEAAVMTSDRYIFGGVAVADCLKNPVKAAQNIVSNLKKGGNWEVIPPMIISGNGINSWAKENNFITVSNDNLISESARKGYSSINKLLSLDTCGGCSITKNTEISSLSCVSSGGVAFKQDGRIGHSIMFGAAIWSECTNKGQSVSISISGFGEAIYRTHLAQKISNALLKADNDNEIFCSVIENFLRSEFLDSPQNSLFPNERLLCGGIVLFLNSNTNHSEIISFHNTPNFVFAFSDGNKVKCCFSELKNEGDFMVSSHFIKYPF